MSTFRKKVQRKKLSLKPYVYPRCSEITASYEKEMFERIRFFNSGLRNSRRQTMVPSHIETIQDLDEIDTDTNKILKNSKIREEMQYSVNDDDCKTSISLFSRINKLKQAITSKTKRNSFSERNEHTQDSRNPSLSHNSHNSYQRLKKLYQTEIKVNMVRSVEMNQNGNSDNNKNMKQSKIKEVLQFVDLTNIHNCSITRNVNENSKQSEEDSYDLSRTARTNSYQRANHNKKKKSLQEIQIHPNNKFNVGLYSKLQQLKNQKQSQRMSFMVFSNQQYF